MGVLFDYFAAPSDEAAASALETVGGPAAAPTGSFDAVTFRVDPVVQLGKLESLLTGLAYEAVTSDPRSGHAVAVGNEGEQFVLAVTDRLQAAIASADDARLSAVAVPWSQTEEFWGMGDPGDVADGLRRLASLARNAVERGERLYCWVSL
jgi:hypothetical protein